MVRGLFLTSVIVLGLTVPALERADAMPPLEDYCCVCTECAGSPPSASLCIGVAAFNSAATNCADLCSGATCSQSNVLEGGCAASAEACGGRLAPAVSNPVLGGLAILLAAIGFFTVRRRAALR